MGIGLELDLFNTQTAAFKIFQAETWRSSDGFGTLRYEIGRHG